MANTFKEYLDSKGKIKNPETCVVADKVDMPKGRETKPPKAVGMAKDGKNYKQPQAEGDKKAIKYGKSEGLGDLGCDKDMVYDVTANPKPAKIPTAESFIRVFPKVTGLINDNPALVEHLVMEFKNSGLLSVLVAELSTHNETYKHLSDIMANENYGVEFCSKLMRAVTEEVAPPFGEEETDTEEKAKDKADTVEPKDKEAVVKKDKAEKKGLPALEHLHVAMTNLQLL